MNGELWLTLVDTADIVGFSMTFCVNIVLLFLLKNRGKNLGTYKHLMAFFSVFSIFYAIIESILRPIMHIENATFFLISRKRFNYSTRLGKINSAFYCACFATSFVVSGVHFVYRFFASCKPHLLRSFNMPYLLLWPLGCSIPVTMWASVSYFLYPDTAYTEEAVTNVLKTHYNWIKKENVSYIAYVYYQYDENGVRYVYLKNLLGCFVHYFVMSATFVVMFICGYSTWKTMREHKTASDRTRQLQKQLFKALVLQTLIPTIFMYSPTGVMFIAPFFSIDLNANANFIVFCSFLYPGLDPLILILIIRDFRQTVFMFICLRKKNSVDESRSTTRANMSQCWKADPCDDFYRYACPRGDYGLLTTVDFRDLIDDVKYQRIGENWKNALIRSDYETFKKRVKRITSKYGLISFFTKSFSSICKSDEKSIPSFVSNMGKVLSRVLNNGSIRSHIENEIYGCKIEDEDFERIITQYFDGFQRLDRTPWARNFNGTGKIQNLIRQIDMNKNVTDSIDEQHRLLSNINENYRTCSSQYRNIQSFEKLCFVFTATPLEYIEPPFFDNENAVNRQNSFLAFGLSFFYYNTYSKWRAAKLGFTGFTVGHEMAHTFVEVHRNPRELGYFSKESQKCVQDQFQKSCDFFGEGECYAALSQFDDNGADIFGLQLAYDLLEKDMSQQMKHTVNGLGKFGVTNEQLFFYAYAFGFCSGKESSMDLNKMQKTGEHSANNVRINVAAQHPGFQKAFQCSDDSRMMRSATDQCIIYGKYAPETRKKFIQPK